MKALLFFLLELKLFNAIKNEEKTEIKPEKVQENSDEDHFFGFSEEEENEVFDAHFFSPPPPEVSLIADESSSQILKFSKRSKNLLSQVRSLQAVSIQIVNNFILAQTKIEILPRGSITPITRVYQQNFEGTSALYAGMQYSQVAIRVQGTHQFFVNSARFNIVKGTPSTASAQNGYCRDASSVVGPSIVDTPWSESPYAPTTNRVASGGPVLYAETQSAGGVTEYHDLTFKMGGTFRLCYSSDGSFGNLKTDTPEINLVVNGASDNCLEEDCLTSRVYNCWVLWEEAAANNSCIVRYSGYTPTTQPGNLTWSEEYTWNVDSSGKLISSQSRSCPPSSPSSLLCGAGQDCTFRSGLGIMPDAGTGNLEVRLPQPNNTLSGFYFKPYALSSCYCPALDVGIDGTCNEGAEFIQQVGVIHYYATKVCSPVLANCTEEYFVGVSAEQDFKVRVECPAGACDWGLQSRAKIVQVLDRSSNSLDLPSWQSSHGCYSAVHSPLLVQPWTCSPGSPTNCSLHGGWRQDYKEFGGNTTLDYRFVAGTTSHEKLNFHERKEFDVCFCNSDCTVAENYFKVGQFHFSGIRPSSGYTFIGDKRLFYQFLEYVNKPGIVAFYRNHTEAKMKTLGLQNGGIIKLFMDNSMSLSNDECRSRDWDTSLVPQLSSLSIEKYVGSEHLLFPGQIGFNNETNTTMEVNNMHATQAGVMAVCYCAFVNGNSECLDSSLWGMVLRFTLKGPNLNQVWEFSTNIVIRFEYFGFGLNSENTVRILTSSGDCQANNGNPIDFEFTVNTGCPETCSQVSSVENIETNIPTKTVAWDSIQCDPQNSNCGIAYITDITVVSDTHTQIEFNSPPYLLDGDVMVIPEGVQCNPDSAACNSDKLAVMMGKRRRGRGEEGKRQRRLSGIHQYADYDHNNVNLTDSYLLGHTLSPITGSQTKYLLNQGWPESDRPLFTLPTSEAKWRLVNRGLTKEEIQASSEKTGLKVCWSYGGTGNYLVEAGTMSFLDPSNLADALVSLSSTGRGAKSPMVISFRTASAETGRQYSLTSDYSQLRLVFTDTSILDVFQSDLEAQVIDASAQSENEFVEATQYICGKLFTEVRGRWKEDGGGITRYREGRRQISLQVWASDAELGFPVPHGCYYRTFSGSREIYMVFAPLNGLKADTQYQVVMYGTGYLGINNEQSFVHVQPMLFATQAPYQIVEMGRPLLSRLTETVAGSTDPQFLSPGGLEIAGDAGTILQLTSQDLSLELKGSTDSNAGITASSILRIFLWPLTQWDLSDSTLQATCTPADSTNVCGDITDAKSESVVPNMNQNVMKIKLPTSMTTLSGDVIMTLSISGIILPPTGFFPHRLAAQVTRSDDLKPHYIVSTGKYVWKEPDTGFNIAKLVAIDGDHRPFKSDLGNIVYAKLGMAATLFSAGSATSVASFTITAPEGYTCIGASSAEDDLNVFGNMVPQGRGTVERGSTMWSFSGRTCTYSLSGYDVIYAGSSLFVKLFVHNPSIAIPQNEPTNRWTLTIRSKGFHSQAADPYEVTPEVFTTTDYDNYYGALPVMGKLTNYLIQPTNYAVSSELATNRQTIHVWFKTDQSAGSNSYVLIHAPYYFNFEADCQASDLPEWAYATGSTQDSPTMPLPTILSCLGMYNVNPRPNLQAQNATFTASTLRNQALVQSSLRLEPQTQYGLSLGLINPKASAVNSSETEWYIYTLNKDFQYIDGTPTNVPGSLSTSESWKLYSKSLPSKTDPELNGDFYVDAKISSLIPYKTSGEYSSFYFYLYNIPESVNSSLRVTLPEGYRWTRTDYNIFLSCLNCTYPNNNLLYVQMPNITSDWPTDAPTNSTPTQLIFPPNTVYNNSFVYGFMLPIAVPDFPSTRSTPYILVEFGYEKESLEERYYAATIGVGEIGALSSASVERSTSVVGKLVDLTFTLRTVTSVRYGKGHAIVIETPEGFENLDGLCQVSSAHELSGRRRLQSVSELPIEISKFDELVLPSTTVEEVDITVAQAPSLLEEVLPQATEQEALEFGYLEFPEAECVWNSEFSYVSILPRRTDIPGGLYRFRISGLLNPSAPRSSVATEATTCGFSECFQFHSISNFSVGVHFSPRLDAGVSAPGYTYNVKLDQAKLAEVTLNQKIASGRDDRPLYPNNVIIQFRLTVAKPTPEQDRFIGQETYPMSIEAPEGFVMQENCLIGFETRSDKVFGPDSELASLYTSWPTEGGVRSCVGEGNQATLTIGAGFLRERIYVFRIRVGSNPRVTPADHLNYWMLKIGDEASDPFKSFSLSTFLNTRVIPVVTAKNMLQEEAEQVGVPFVREENPVTIRFRPSNTISYDIPTENSGALLVVLAPLAFEFVREADNSCKGFELEELLPFSDPDVYQPTDILCMVPDLEEVGVLNELYIYVRDGGKPLYGGNDYRITVFVYNPTISRSRRLEGEEDQERRKEGRLLQSSPSEDTWVLQSFSSNQKLSSAALDEVYITGFSVLPVLNSWLLRNSDPVTGAEQVYGKTSVTALYASIGLRDRLDPLDLIIMEAPAGFEMCANFQWVTSQGRYLPNSLPACNGRILIIEVTEPYAFFEGQILEWTLDTVNPPTTPRTVENYWKIGHFRREQLSSGQLGQVMPLATSAWQSWTVIPQLENIMVLLLGPLMAATALSSIQVEFTSISPADQLRVITRSPAGFDFSNAKVFSNGHEILDSTGNIVSLRVVIRAGERSVVKLSDVILGQEGGTTEFDIATFLGDLKMDEYLGFRNGFEQPGQVIASNAVLLSEFELSPLQYPVPSLWGVQRSTSADARNLARAYFDISVSRQIDWKEEFRLETYTYTVLTSDFTFIDSETGEAIPLESTRTMVSEESSDGQQSNLRTVLRTDLLPGKTYSIGVSVLTPIAGAYSEQPGWRIETWRLDENAGNPLAQFTTTTTPQPGAVVVTPAPELPTATNDALMTEFPLVQKLGFLTAPSQCLLCTLQHPPGATIPVTLDINPLGSIPDYLYIVAPPDFAFTSPDCLHTYQGSDIVSCRLADYTVANRSVAILTCRRGGLQTVPSSLRVSVETPGSSPSTLEWYVRATRVLSVDGVEQEVEVGWAMHTGWEVRQMDNSRVIYASLPSAQVNNAYVLMAVGFTTRVNFEMAGGRIDVTLPSGYTVDCSELKGFRLPIEGGSRKCEVLATEDGLTHVSIGLNDTMVPTDYAFSFVVTTPETTPEHNVFVVTLVDALGGVKDSHNQIPGFRVQYGTPVLADYKVGRRGRRNGARTPLQVFWEAFQEDDDASSVVTADDGDLSGGIKATSSVVLTEDDIASASISSSSSTVEQVITNFRVELSFTVANDIRPEEGIYGIRIQYPQTVTHNIAQILNERGFFGVVLSENLRELVNEIHLNSTSLLIIYLPHANRQLVTDQTFSISVPVTLPEDDPSPAFNFYQLTFCRGTGTCNVDGGDGFIMTHPVEGFELLDPFPLRENVDGHASTFKLFGLKMRKNNLFIVVFTFCLFALNSF